MSLKDLAQQMKATGRKGDTELVHMTKREVAGLQALAEAAGGTLTTNPKTGLPEASFLERLLPTIIGAGLAFIPGVGPMAAAAAGAGTGALLNEDDRLGGALMGGLGAFGGHGLGAGLSAAGTGAAQSAALQGAAGQTASTMAAGVDPGLANALRPELMANASTAAANQFAAQPFLSRAGQGIQALGDAGGRTAFMQSVGGLGGLAKDVGMAGAPLIMSALTPRGGPSEMPGEKEDTEDLMGRYEYRANPTGGTRPAGSAFTGERVFFQPEYRRMFAAKGGEVKKFADGGEASASSSVANPARGMSGVSADAMNYLYQMDPAQQDGGASAEAMQYLMGQTPRSQPEPKQSLLGGTIDWSKAVSTAPKQGQSLWGPGETAYSNPFGAPARTKSNISSTEGYNLIGEGPYAGLYQSDRPQYVFDPGSQQFFRTDPVFSYSAPVSYGYDNPYMAAEGGEVPDGGIAALARGGMKAGGFVIPADVVSMVGEGNTDAGYDRIKRMIPGSTPIKGKDGGQADTVATSIEGKQPARIAHGEMYVPPAAVKRAGGAKKLYAMMKNVRKQAKGDDKQIKPVNLKKAMA